MFSKEFIQKFRVEFWAIALMTIIVAVIGWLVHYITERYFHINSDLLQALIWVMIGVIVFGIYSYKQRQIAIEAARVAELEAIAEHIHTTFVTSEKIEGTPHDDERFHVDEMYFQLKKLVRESTHVRIVDNTTSQLDHVKNLESRKTFLAEIQQQLKTNTKFQYQRIEILYTTTEKLHDVIGK